jgi:hypothetical protein
MDQFYVPLQEAFEALEKEGIIERCPCGTTLRRGWKECEWCNGAGFRNATREE